LVDPAKTYETNVIGTINVLEAAKSVAGVRSIVVASSHKIYEDKEQPWAYRENDPLNGSDPLTDIKVCVESIVKTYRKFYFKDYGGTAVSTARIGNLFGGGDYRKGKILSDCINATRENKVIEVHQSSSVRPYMHVLDAVKGMLLLAQRQYEEKRFEGEYNFGPDYDECIRTGDLVMMFCKEWGEGCHSRLAVPMEPHFEPQIIRLDTARSKSILWWNPKLGIKDAMKEYVEWEKSVFQGIKADVITEQQIKRNFI
jgi:CDP-glucose 4,6-dehydratase